MKATLFLSAAAIGLVRDVACVRRNCHCSHNSRLAGRRGLGVGDGGPGGPATATANNPSDSTNSVFATGGKGGNGGDNGGAGGAATHPRLQRRPTRRGTARACRPRRAVSEALARKAPTPTASPATEARRPPPPSRQRSAPRARCQPRRPPLGASGGSRTRSARLIQRGKRRRCDRFRVGDRRQRSGQRVGQRDRRQRRFDGGAGGAAFCRTVEQVRLSSVNPPAAQLLFSGQRRAETLTTRLTFLPT